MAKIVGLRRYPEGEDVLAEALDEMILIKGVGIEGERKRADARQVSLLTEDACRWAQAQENLCCGKTFNANILLDGSLKGVERLTLDDVVLRISSKKFCAHKGKGSVCPLYEGAAFAQILEGGQITVGECFTALK